MKDVLKELFSEKNFKKTLVVIVMIILILIAFILSNIIKKEEPELETKVPIGGHGEEKDDQKKELRTDYQINEKAVNLKESATELTYILKNRSAKLDNFGDFYIYDGYYMFPKRNIKIKKSHNSIINIVFMNSYTSNILGDVGVNSTEEKITKTLGIPNHSENGVLTYRTNKYYAIFDTNIKEVSIYFKDKLDSEVFWMYYKRYEFEKDLKNYISDLTTRYPSYYKYEYDSDGLELVYTNYGIRIYFKEKDEGSAIYLYSDFEENISSEAEMSGIREYSDVKILNTNLVLKEETLRKSYEAKQKEYSIAGKIYSNNRIYKHINVLNSYNDINKDEEKKLEYKNLAELYKYHIYFEEKDSRYVFNNVSIIKKNNMNYNINTAKVADSLLLTHDYVFYSIKNEGIFRLNVNTGQNIQIYSDRGEFELKYLKNTYLHFDDKQIKAL